MSWKDVIKETPEEAKANEAKKFVLSQAAKGMTMEQATRLFAQKFPGQMPPNVEKEIESARRLDEALANLDASRKRYEESQKRLQEIRNTRNPYRPE